MKLVNIAIISASVVIAGVAGVANAGTTTNTWTNGTERTHSTVKVDNIRVEAGNFTRETQNLKIDAVTEPGGFAQANINFNGTSLTGSGVANINNGVDPYVNSGFSRNVETGTLSDITTTKIQQSTDKFDNVRTHSLDTAF
jgi:ABC-type glycerol-3-phosphate transport system substrate-binding protein